MFSIIATAMAAWLMAVPATAQDQFTLVSSTTGLKAGDQIVIANAENGVAMSTNQKANNRDQTAVEINGTTLTATSGVQVFTLEQSGGAWRFRDEARSGWLAATSSSKNILTTTTTDDDNSRALITIAGGAATVTFQGGHTHNLLRYNKSAGIFSCYTEESSVKGEIQLYRRDGEPAVPMAEVASVAAFNALPDGTEARLYLSDGQNARVIHADGETAWLRDNSGTVGFYQFTKNPSMRQGQHVAGYIIGKKQTIDGLAVLTATAKTNTAWLVIAAPVTEPDIADDDPTAIRQPLADGQRPEATTGAIYNIGGQYAGSGKKPLGQGIYIIGGKQHIVK